MLHQFLRKSLKVLIVLSLHSKTHNTFRSSEIATSLGYEVRMTEYFGVAKMSVVKVPVAGFEYYWIGVINRWQYIGQRELKNKND